MPIIDKQLTDKTVLPEYPKSNFNDWMEYIVRQSKIHHNQSIKNDIKKSKDFQKICVKFR